MFDGANEIFVQSVRLVADVVLMFEPLALLDWIVQLAVGILDQVEALFSDRAIASSARVLTYWVSSSPTSPYRFANRAASSGTLPASGGAKSAFSAPPAAVVPGDWPKVASVLSLAHLTLMY